MPAGPSPVAAAIQWVSRITTVALMMVLPGIGGQWLDRHWGTQFLGLGGFAFGVSAGIYYLLKMSPQPKQKSAKPTHRDPSDSPGKPTP